MKCVKSKSVTNLAEATADPAIDLDPVVPVAAVDAVLVPVIEPEGGALIRDGVVDADGLPEQVDGSVAN